MAQAATALLVMALGLAMAPVMAPGLAMMAIAAQALAHTTRIVLHPGVFPILLTLTMMTPE